MKRAFSLTELLITVAVLGILAAVALPVFQSHTRQAREAAAKDNLRILRNAIELYAAQHNGIPPGYPANDPSRSPGSLPFTFQLIGNGKYISEYPKNPFNGYTAITFVGNDEDFPAGPSGSHLYGWIYKPATKKIRLDCLGTDSAGAPYFDY